MLTRASLTRAHNNNDTVANWREWGRVSPVTCHKAIGHSSQKPAKTETRRKGCPIWTDSLNPLPCSPVVRTGEGCPRRLAKGWGSHKRRFPQKRVTSPTLFLNLHQPTFSGFPPGLAVRFERTASPCALLLHHSLAPELRQIRSVHGQQFVQHLFGIRIARGERIEQERLQRRLPVAVDCGFHNSILNRDLLI